MCLRVRATILVLPDAKSVATGRGAASPGLEKGATHRPPSAHARTATALGFVDWHMLHVLRRAQFVLPHVPQSQSDAGEKSSGLTARVKIAVASTSAHKVKLITTNQQRRTGQQALESQVSLRPCRPCRLCPSVAWQVPRARVLCRRPKHEACDFL